MSAFNNYRTIMIWLIPIGYNTAISECLLTNSWSPYSQARAYRSGIYGNRQNVDRRIGRRTRPENGGFTSLLRLYHITVALALTSDSQKLALNHGYVGRLLEAQLGKVSNAGRTVQTLYDLRRRCDYDKPRLNDLYSNLEEIRHGAIYELRMAAPVFDIAYHAVRKELERLSAG